MVLGSSPITTQRIFFFLEFTQLYPKKMRRCLLEGVFASDSLHRILRRGCKAVGPGALVASLATPMCGKLTRAALVLASGYWQDPGTLDVLN